MPDVFPSIQPIVSKQLVTMVIVGDGQ